MLDDMELFELSPVQLNVLAHAIPVQEIKDHLKGLINYVVSQKIQECGSKLFNEWKPKLIQEGIEMIPAKDIEFAKMIFDRPDYVSAVESRETAALQEAKVAAQAEPIEAQPVEAPAQAA